LLFTIVLLTEDAETFCVVLFTETAFAGNSTDAETVSVSVLITAIELLFGDAT
jgi:hypothetical protein